MAPVNPWRESLGALGSIFMTSDLIRSTSKEIGMPASALYFRGRVGVLGDVTTDAAYDVLGIFPRRVIDLIWERSASVSAADAAAAYLDTCHRWGREHLLDDGAARSAADRLEKVLDEAQLAPMLLAQGWQRAERPDDVPARLAQAAMTVRELRGGLYFAALGLVGLSVHAAMVVDSEAGPDRMRSLGWNDDEIAEARDAHRPSDAGRWRDAENALEGAFIGLLGDVLGADGVTVLAEALLAVKRTTTR
ncbi:helix-turn-helix domain-containing protein [Mumia qirimensis]|uniref:helix-turn-helix domain-containing protein n=1 Tax=Mumia qirimensis TaxID=3234852 RepID=UPI00351D3578